MPTSNFTAKLFELEDIIITDFTSSNAEIHIHFSLPRKVCTCPHCHGLTDKVHDYRTSIIKDLPIMGKHTFLHYRKRRYHCPLCGKHFYEPFSLAAKHCRTTTRLAFYAIHLLSERQSVRSVSRLLDLSDSYIFRRLKAVQFPKPDRLPTVLSIDEFKGNAGGEKFQAILTCPDKRCLFDILPSRSQVSLQQYFQDFKNKKEVRFIVMDMNKVYRSLAEIIFLRLRLLLISFTLSVMLPGPWKMYGSGSRNSSIRKTEIFQTEPQASPDPPEQTKRGQHGFVSTHAVPVRRSCSCLSLKGIVL